MLPSRGLRLVQSGRASQAFQSPKSLNSYKGRAFSSFPHRTASLRLQGTRPTTVAYDNLAVRSPLAASVSKRSISLWPFGGGQTSESKSGISEPSEQLPAAIGTPAPSSSSSQSPSLTGDTTSTSLTSSPETASASTDYGSIVDIVNNTAEDVLYGPVQPGFLKALGLDYGWGPTSCMQWLLEHVHVWSGLGWAGSIVATAFVLRAVMFWPHVKNQRFAAKMQRMKDDPRSKENLTLMREAMATGDQNKMQRSRMLGRVLRDEYQISTREYIWVFLPLPFTFGLFRILSGMAALPVPELQHAGLLWFENLTVPDPYYLLPLAATGIMVTAVKINSKYANPQQMKMMKPMLYFFGIFGVIATSFLSAGVNLMGLSIGISTLITSIITNNPTIRRSLGLPVKTPFIPDAATAAAAASSGLPAEPTGLRERLTKQLNDAKSGFSEQISNATGMASADPQTEAAKKRREMMEKLEQTRSQQERERFSQKYKKR